MKEDKKYNIFLDLDQSIISGELLKEYEDDDEEEDEEEVYNINGYRDKAKKFTFYTMDNDYVIFERPGLQKFLDYIFANYNVSVWTAASKDYALFIAKKCILSNRSNRKLDFIFWSYHCDMSTKVGKGTKDLSLLWDYYKIPGYNDMNTYILDDYDHVFNIQPKNCIIAPPFYFRSKYSDKDKFLYNLIKRLKNINSLSVGHQVIDILNDGNYHENKKKSINI